MSRPKDKGKLTTKEKTEEEAVALAVYPQYARMVGVPLCSFTVQCNICCVRPCFTHSADGSQGIYGTLVV